MTPNMNSIWEDMLTWRILAQMKVFCFKTMSLLFFPKTSSLSSHTTFVLQIRYRKTIEDNIIAPELVQQCSQLAKLSHGPQFSCLLNPLKSFHGQGCGYHWWWQYLFFFLTSWWLTKTPYSISSSTLYMDSWPGRDGWMDLGVYSRHLMWRFCSIWAPFVHKREKNLSLGNLAWI